MSVILITGTSTGIGLGVALHFARKGDRVYAAMRKPEAAEELNAAIEAEQLPITPIRIDVDDDASVSDGVAAVLKEEGHVDVLINNAGIGGAVVAIEEASMDDLRGVMETNYFGAMRMIKAVIPGMRERRTGMVINVTSAAGVVATPNGAGYAASKFALEAASDSLAQEMAEFGVRVAVIQPGVIFTPIFSKTTPAGDESLYAKHTRRLTQFVVNQLQKPVMPAAVAEVIETAIASEEALARYTVGPDAAAMVPARRGGSDADYVACAAHVDDEAYYAGMRAYMGADLMHSNM